ncbi:SAM-dependent methyltransferase [Treponema bryantii]|uniref:class I SAM-dependent methyltransferase n=1 Tax=Treponema bryantii TaxID=163 RepID=UPI002B319BC9|nr:SAM-dependent methyltransferase [Treponema bryantii]
MILSVTLSKPAGDIEKKLGRPYQKIKFKLVNTADGALYQEEMFTKTQVFHNKMTEAELSKFLDANVGTTFKNCVKRTENEEITLLTNKKGKITELRKTINVTSTPLKVLPAKKKNYLLPEGAPVPFLVLLGIMNDEGKVISSRHDKFRQINRFLEFIDDILPEFADKTKEEESLRIADFGCGKSYLTFAVHYFLTEIRHIPCEIEGLDLKEEVIKYCNDMAQKLELKGLIFHTGNIADYSGSHSPDIVITLHACDTATDFALKYAVERGARAILSVPCCQHQINTQLQTRGKADGAEGEVPAEFEPLLKWGIIREKFSSLVTDALRGEWLEQQGYKVQMLEFIDMEHTPKNILIRAIKKAGVLDTASPSQPPELMKSLGITPEFYK